MAGLSVQVNSGQVPPAAENEAFPITFWSFGIEESEEREERGKYLGNVIYPAR